MKHAIFLASTAALALAGLAAADKAPANAPYTSGAVLTGVKAGTPVRMTYELQAKAYILFIPATGRATFPRLRSYGASLRRPMAGGIANIELGYYDSRDDRAGNDPFVANSEFRLLAGFERELAPNLTGAVQYYLEHMADNLRIAESALSQQSI